MPLIHCFSRPSQSQEITPYDSMICKAVTCIPIVGVVSGLMIEARIAHQIESSREIANTIRLIEVKNHYKIAAIVQGLIIIAAIATLIATGIFQTMPQLAIGGSSIALVSMIILLHGYRIYCNEKVMSELWNDGFDTPRRWTVV